MEAAVHLHRVAVVIRGSSPPDLPRGIVPPTLARVSRIIWIQSLPILSLCIGMIVFPMVITGPGMIDHALPVEKFATDRLPPLSSSPSLSSSRNRRFFRRRHLFLPPFGPALCPDGYVWLGGGNGGGDGTSLIGTTAEFTLPPFCQDCRTGQVDP